MHRFVILSLFLAACGGGSVGIDTSGKDTGSGDSGSGGGGGGGGGGGDTDTGPPPECNTDNEDCRPGTCEDHGSPSMLPGSDCLECHDGSDHEAPKWSAAGTIFVDEYGTDALNNATVTITDSKGTTATAKSNSSGNFYTDDKLTPPLSVVVSVGGTDIAMSQDVSTGACDSCHKCDGEAGGKLYGP